MPSALFEYSSTNLLLTNLVIGPLHCLLWIQDPQVLQTILPEIMNHLNHLVGRGELIFRMQGADEKVKGKTVPSLTSEYLLLKNLIK